MVVNDEVKLLIRKLALQNAVKFNGKASPGAIVSGVLGDHPGLKEHMKTLMAEINHIVQDVNSIDVEIQKEELLRIDPAALDKKEHKVDLFGFLNIAEGEKIRTAFPPGPEKYPHIGHAKALLLNFLLAQKYNGEFYLRFEDTNPDVVREEFYGIMERDFKWLGVSWNKLQYASDHMELFYKHCEDTISKDKAYVCTCNSEAVKMTRETGEPCKCRARTVKENLELWKKMPEMKTGDAIVRMKIDLKHKNSTMRDPTIFRIIETPHPRLGTKIKVWPNYDFQNSIMDGHFNITHRLRSKEFEMRNELQRYIQTMLGYKETKIYEFARFNLEGVLSSGRVIREKVASGELTGWDDPSLTTLAALRRRGFQPEAIREFVVKTGITKSESTLTWDDLIVQNRRILDDKSNRYFFVEEPVKIKVAGAPKKTVTLNLHPEHRKGGRTLHTHDEFFISKKDHDSLEPGKIYRLMECINFKCTAKDKFEFVDEEIATYKAKGSGILHYLPADAKNLSGEILKESKYLKGLVEENILKEQEGTVVQFERFGFCRLDSKEKMIFWFTH
ncbi:MAG: glutamate--tRNA ligase [Candidatus Nanoarchaeia archaeon]